MIPYGRQDVGEDDIRAVVDVLRSDFLTQGPAVPAFEKAVAAYCGAPHAVAVNSATSALHVACLALGVGPGDRVWTSPITFVASANCALYCGARVDFVDIDERTYCMSTEALTGKLASAERRGELPRVVIPVHFAGQSCDMAGIHALSRRYGFRIIEDASHAIGGRHLKDRIGAGRLSDITVFSFHAVKVITTGEGGMALTRDHTLAGTMRRLRSHGTTRNVEEMTHAPDGPWYYQQRELGFNYRMTDVQAALGTSQMGRLDAFLEKRRALARRYDAALTSLPLVGPWQHPDNDSAWHLYVVRVDQSRGRSRRVVFEALRAAGIGANVHYIPVHRQPYFEALGFRRGQFPAAEAYYEEAISLPLHPRLQEAQQDYIVATLGGAMC